MEQNKEYENTRKEWDKLKLNYKQAREAEQKLSKALDKAVLNGADKETVGNILKTWQQYNDKANAFESQLLKEGKNERPDLMQSYAAKTKENVQKGMHLLGDKVEKINAGVKEGSIKIGQEVTNRVKAAHHNVSAVFHEKQQELTEKLKASLDKIKDEQLVKVDERRLDSWVKAVDAAEQFDKNIEGNLNKIEDKKNKSIDQVLKNRDEALNKNKESFEKTVKDIDEGIPSRSQRFNASAKTAFEAAANKEFVNNLSDEKIAENAGKEYKKAKDKLKGANLTTKLKAKAQIGVIKAWAGVQSIGQKIKSKIHQAKAKVATKNLEKIKNPKVNDIVKKIQEAQMKTGSTLGDAKESVMKNKDKVADAAKDNMAR